MPMITTWTYPILLITLFVLLLSSLSMLLKSKLIPALGLLSISTYAQNASSSIGLNWYPPIASEINNLSTVINGTGVYGFIFNSSVTPGSYETYNWCNMPRVRQQEYIRADEEWELAYVEVVGFGLDSFKIAVRY